MEVLEQRFEEGKAAGIAVLLFGLLPAAEAEVRLAASFGGGEAALEIFVNGELQVGGDFRIEVTVEFRATE